MGNSLVLHFKGRHEMNFIEFYPKLGKIESYPCNLRDFTRLEICGRSTRSGEINVAIKNSTQP